MHAILNSDFDSQIQINIAQSRCINRKGVAAEKKKSLNTEYRAGVYEFRKRFGHLAVKSRADFELPVSGCILTSWRFASTPVVLF